jgi:hypothetical protein
VIVVASYRGHRIEVNAVAVDGRYNAEVRILRLFSRDKPHVDTVTCSKLTAKHAEWSGEAHGGAGSVIPSIAGSADISTT